MLEVHHLTKHFGGLNAVADLSFSVRRGEILGLIGPNGAGKTTVFNLLSGFLWPSAGRIVFDGHEITGFKPNKTASLGLVRTFQLINLVGKHTVLENTLAGYHLQRRVGVCRSVVRTPAARQEERRIREAAISLLNEMELGEYRDEVTSNLSHGMQKALGLCIALAAKPKMLLLDEPTAGMSVSETSHITKRINQARDQGQTIMLVEHDLKMVMGICDRIVVLNFGNKIAEGTPQEVAADETVVSAYLGLKKAKRDGR